MMGASVLNKDPRSPRYSKDIDVSHDIAESVTRSAEADVELLTSQGFEVMWLVRRPTFQRARAARGQDAVVLDWVADSAFRFFPVQPDPLFGWGLHFFDAATNKVLAMAGRAEARDYVDVIELHRHYLSLGALAWSAAGKDPGLSPQMILELSHRFARYQRAEIEALDLAQPPDIADLKATWLVAVERGRELLGRLDPEEIGCVYLDSHGDPVEPDPTAPGFSALTRHWGTVGGAWPRLGSS
jgi:hypothetical protein